MTPAAREQGHSMVLLGSNNTAPAFRRVPDSPTVAARPAGVISLSAVQGDSIP